jgi:hypothetical protein
MIVADGRPPPQSVNNLGNRDQLRAQYMLEFVRT